MSPEAWLEALLRQLRLMQWLIFAGLILLALIFAALLSR